MRSIILSLMMLLAPATTAQDATNSKGDLNVSGHGKTALIPSERHKKGMYDSRYNFAPGVRAGDFIFISGGVAGAFSSDDPIGKDEFKASIRRVFNDIKKTLEAGNADINNVVKLRTFHVFDSPHITISKREQVAAVAEVKNEFIKEPHPAWTAVGTTALFPDKGLVEIEVVVYAPEK